MNMNKGSGLLSTRTIFVIVVFMGLFVLASRNVTDPDVWWHLRTGQLIIQNQKLFHSDPYSFTKFGQPWVDHEWLPEITIFTLYKTTGWAGLITAFAALITAAFLLVFTRCPGRPYIAGVVTVWAAVASVPSWGVRPQMFTLLLASIFLWLLDRSYKQPKVLWWIPPLMLLWVNLHGGYALGIGLLIVYLLGDALDLAFGSSEARRPLLRLRDLALCSTICVALVPVNPYGIALYRYPFQTLHSRSMLAYIGEWSSPNFHEGRYAAVLLMMLATLVLPAVSPRRLRAGELLILGIMTCAALRSVRHIPIYVLVAAPLVSSMLEASLSSTMAAWFGHPAPLNRSKAVLNVMIVSGFLLFGVLRIRYVVGRQPQAEGQEFPSAATAFLQQAHVPTPMMNHYNWGGYFIWKLYPEYRVFIDGRADVYGDTLMDEFASAYFIKGELWRATVDKWGLQTIVLPPDAPLITALKMSRDWTEVFSDQQTVVLTRRKPE